jgi:DNA-binding PadR family transcriptional regulator
MARKKARGTELSVFKGREAKLNRAIFKVLAVKESQTIYEIHQQIRAIKGFKHIHYGNVNKRVRALEQKGYAKVSSTRNTKAGFEVLTYELTSKAFLAMKLGTETFESFLLRMDEQTALEIMALIVALT